MSIRRARVADVAALVELERTFPSDRLSARSFRDLIRGGRADVWIYEQAGTLLGNAVVLYRRGTRIARLYSLVVTPRARGRGIGGALLDWTERNAARRACAELRLEVRSDNTRAQTLYASRGYARLGTRPNFYDDGKPAVVWGKTLRQATPRLTSRPHRTRRPVPAAGNATMRTSPATTRAPRSSRRRRG